MKVYYLQQLINNVRPIVLVLYEREVFSYDLSTLSPYDVVTIDEIDQNKTICKDLSRHASQGKYYVDNLGDIYEVEGWQPQEEV